MSHTLVEKPSCQFATDTPVVIFRAENYAALGMVRSLGRMGVKVYCIDHEPDALATKSKYCSGVFKWDFESSKDEDSINYLIEVAKSLECKPILLPTFDHRNLLVDRYRNQLAPWYQLPKPTDGALTALYDKRSMHAMCKAHGIPTPHTTFPTSISDAMTQAGGFEYPLVIKALDGDLLMRTRGCRLAVVYDRAELEREFHRLHDPEHPNLALQEFIPGGLGDATWMLNAYFDRSGHNTFALTGRKLRQLPVNGGMTAFGECAPCDTLAPAMAAIVKASGYHGVIDADFIHDQRDGRWKLIDINPRVGATFRLFVDKNGTDCVRAMYFDLTGQKTPPTEPQWHRRWMVEDKDLLSAVWSLRHRRLSLGDWLRSLRGVKEFAHVALDDWAPSWQFLRRFVGGHLVRRFRRKGH